MAKKKKSKFNNSFKVHNDEADKIRNLPNDELLDYLTKKHELLRMLIRSKKMDAEIMSLKDHVKRKKEELWKSDSRLEKLLDEVKNLKEELKDDELVDYENQLKDASQPLNLDIQENRGMFNLSMEEVRSRKELGILKIAIK